jgi:hypothetical protein
VGILHEPTCGLPNTEEIAAAIREGQTNHSKKGV